MWPKDVPPEHDVARPGHVIFNLSAGEMWLGPSYIFGLHYFATEIMVEANGKRRGGHASFI
jgi:hypothetical protein